MSQGTVVKHSHLVRQAIRWISERRKQDPGARIAALLAEAGPRFNLSPADQESLALLLRDELKTLSSPAQDPPGTSS